MKPFVEAADRLRSLLPWPPDARAAFDPAQCAAEGDKNAILFRSDTAYELGGGGKPSAGCVIFGGLPEAKSEVLLYGPDLNRIREDTPFAHVTLVRLKEQNEDGLSYELLKTIGFTVFQVYPAGYHVRISPSAAKEQVRVAKAALAAEPPLSFLNVGCSLIGAFLAHPEVEAVQTLFVTRPDADYAALSALALRTKRITDAVQSALGTETADCAACEMKPLCDEIDGLRELHFNKRKGE